MVDDEKQFLEQSKKSLEKINDGFDINILASTEKAFDELEENNYDLIVSGYQMDNTNGLEFLESLREEKNIDLPFIMFTGKGREKVAMRALNLGADRYIRKGGNLESQYGVLAQGIEQEAEHYQTKKAAKRTKKKIEKLHEVALRLDENEKKKEVFNTIVEVAEEILEFDFIGIRTLENGKMTVKACSDKFPSEDMEDLPRSDSIAGLSYEIGQSFLIDSVQDFEKANPTSEKIKSAITAPIGDYGVFQSVSYDKNSFDEDDLRLAELLISHAENRMDKIETKQKLRDIILGL